MAEVKAVAKNGFSLVELLIVVGILAVIASIAYPNYRDNLIRANRSDAHIAIQKVIMAQERHYAIQNAYTDNMASLGAGTSAEGMYTVSTVLGAWSGANCASAASSSAISEYTVLALPVAGKSQASDSECTCIYIDSRGVKGSTGSRSSAEDCW